MTDDPDKLMKADPDVIVEATGTVDAGARHAWVSLKNGKHVVMASAEADSLLGLALQKKAIEKGEY